MPHDEAWPSAAIQKAILRDFAAWINRDDGLVAGVYTLNGKRKYTPVTSEMLNNAVDRFLQEQGDGQKRSGL